jgi:folate-dependent phosphoribosylglycinamide formyltransferase PurN
MRSGNAKIIQSWLRHLPDYLPCQTYIDSSLIDYQNSNYIYKDNLLVGFINERGSFIDPLAYSKKLISREDLISLKVANIQTNPSNQLKNLENKISHSSEIKPDINSAVLETRKNILILGPESRNKKIAEELKIINVNVNIFSDDIMLYPKLYNEKYDLVVSNGYAFKLPIEFLNNFNNNVINLHASFLPWGKGIGALLYDCLYMNPLGISAHLIDSNLDTGGIIYRVRIQPKIGDTARTLYIELLSKIESNASKLVATYLKKPLPVFEQKLLLDYVPVTSSRFNFESLMRLLPNGYDTEIDQLLVLGCIVKNNANFLGCSLGRNSL